MICPNCGTQNDDNSAFCTNCGATLANNNGGFNQGAPANGTLGFAEGARKVLGFVGTAVLREPERFKAFIADECDQHTREYLVFERNCVPVLLEPYANAANSSDAEELSRAAWMAEQYLGEQRAEDVSTAREIATSLASAVASVSGQPFNAQPFNAQQANGSQASAQQFGTAAPTGTVLVGAQSAAANNGANPNVGTGTSTLTTPTPYASQPNPNNNKRNLAPLIGVVVVLVAILAGLLAFILLNPGSTGSSSSASSSSTSSSSAASDRAVVTFDGGSADSGSMEAVEIEDGSIVVPKCSYKRDGYEFVSWVDNKGNEYEPGDTLKAGESTTLTAKWASVKEKQEASSDSSSSSSVGNSSSSASQSGGAQTTQKASPAASFPRMWSGTYVGTSSYVGGDHHITRAVAFNFTSVTDAGDLEGICYVGSEETGAGETYGTCYVAGSVDWNSGAISIYGTGWIDQGGLGDLREYGGSVNFSTQTMGGTAWDIGTGLYETPWDVHAVSEINIWQNGSLTTLR